MTKNFKKYILSAIIGALTFILFACNYIFYIVKVTHMGDAKWLVWDKLSLYSLVGKGYGFGAFMVSAFGIVLLFVSLGVVILSVLGMLSEKNKIKINDRKFNLTKVLQWFLFISLIMNFLMLFWLWFKIAHANKSVIVLFRYAIAFTPFLSVILNLAVYSAYSLMSNGFLFIPSFWKKDKSVAKEEKVKVKKIKKSKKDEDNNSTPEDFVPYKDVTEKTDSTASNNTID